MEYKIIIKDYEVDGHVKYTFLIVSQASGVSWYFKRRYSILRTLHEQLTHSLSILLPSFPPKKCWGNLRAEFIETRMKALGDYFDRIVQIADVCNHKIFKSFITPSDRVNAESPVTQPTPPSLSKSLKKSEEFIQQVVDKYRGKMIRIEFPEPNIDDYELVKKQDFYLNAMNSLTFALKDSILPAQDLGQDVDEGAFEWIESAFAELIAVSGDIESNSRLIYGLK